MNLLIPLVVCLPLMLLFGFISAILSGCETAVTSLNYFKIKQWSSQQKNKQSYYKQNQTNHLKLYKHKRLLTFIEKYNEILTTILIVNTLSNTTVATLGTYLFGMLITKSTIAIWVATISVTLVLLIFCEIIPKIWARINPEKYLLTFFWVLYFFVFIFKFFVVWIVKVNQTRNGPLFSENELIGVIDNLQKQGLIEKKEEQLISSAIKFDEKNLNSIITPLNKVSYMMISTSYQSYQKLFLNSNYSRIPIINTAGNLFIGYIHVKEVYKKIIHLEAKEKKDQELNLKKIINPITIMPNNLKLDQALEQFQATNTHMAGVIHFKTKKLLGIITIEDLLEELVGEIYDEDDIVGSIQAVGHHKFIVNGNVLVKRIFRRQIRIKLHTMEYHYNLYEWFMAKTSLANRNQPLVYENYIFTMKKKYARKKWSAQNTKISIEMIV